MMEELYDQQHDDQQIAAKISVFLEAEFERISVRYWRGRCRLPKVHHKYQLINSGMRREARGASKGNNL
jgi:hypothetical protein